MKSKNKQLVALAAGIALVLIIWIVIRLGESSNSSKVNVQVLNSPKLASKNSKEGPTEADPNQNPESKRQMPTSGRKEYYEIVGPTSEWLEIDESLVISRVRLGLSCLRRGTFVTEAKRMSDLGEAYNHLIHNEVFMGSNFPIWGIETEGYFVFSGYPNSDQQKAFRNGYAVKKDDGRIFKWWLENDE